MNDYRAILKHELEQRQARNGSYSLRAFARDLSVSPAFLTLLFKGKKSLSETRAHVISERIGWNKSRRKIFTTLVRFESARNSRAKGEILHELAEIKGQDTQFFKLRLDAFKVIAEWYHYAILELTCVEDFSSEPKFIADRLGITVSEAKQAVRRLTRLGLLRDTRGRLGKTLNNYSTFDAPSEAIRDFHKQVLAKAAESVDKQNAGERDVSGITMAIDPELLPRARELVRRFESELMELLESGKKTHVYQLCVQLFRLDTREVQISSKLGSTGLKADCGAAITSSASQTHVKETHENLPC